MDFLRKLFDTDFMSHGHCYLWRPEVVWLHVVSDLLIATAYYFIPFTLIYIVRKRQDLVFNWMFLLFGIFIFSCGTTHIMSVWTVWEPVYRLDGVVKAVTAFASVPTAILLIRLVPDVLRLPSPDQLLTANQSLAREVRERKAVEEEVRRLNAELEGRVRERTSELQEVNARLRESNRSLRASESRMNAILDSSPALVYMKDLEGRYTFVNRRFERIFQVNRDQVLGKTADEIFPERTKDVFRDNERKVLEQAGPIEFEELSAQPDGLHTYLTVNFPLMESDDAPYAVCGISTDITERKHAEAALRRYNADLEQFAFVAAHDLQEPLRIITTYTQFLHRRYTQKLDSTAEDFMNYIVEAASRMRRQVSDLTDYAHVVNEGRKPGSMADMGALAQQATEKLQGTLSETRGTVQFGDLPTISADPQQMLDVLVHVIGNSLKFRSETEPPFVRVEGTWQSHEWLFSVQDNGIGFDMQYSERIFVLFQRLFRDQYPGTGIGLTISKKIIEGYGGRMWARSEIGKGSTFFFTMPA